MEKYLFNDGTNVIREIQSKEELRALADPLDPQKLSVWVFQTSEWISYTEFRNRYLRGSSSSDSSRNESAVSETTDSPGRQKSGLRGLGKWMALGAASVVILLIYNFTRVSWEAVPDLNLQASRPENAPQIDGDSLQAVLEARRGTALDKVTRTNLRIRNGWPDRILLSLQLQRDSSSEGVKYQPGSAVLDNATGYLLDEVEAEFNVWKNGRSVHSELINFNKVNYTEPGRKEIAGSYVGDSVSLHFRSIRSKAFNFCYSYDKQSNYGNLSDRWFCR